MPEIRTAIADGRLRPDGTSCANGDVRVTKVAIEPVWHLPGIAHASTSPKDSCAASSSSRAAGMFPELVTRPDLHVFLPPIGGMTVYLFGDVAKLGRSRPHRLPGARRVQRL